MKKFIKYGTIIGCAMILAGTGITTAAFAVGANPKRITQMVDERWFDENDHWIWEDPRSVLPDHHAESVEERTGTAVASGENDEPWMSPGTEGGFEAGYPFVSRLKIRQEGGTVEVYVLEDIGELTVKSADGSLENLRCREADGRSELTLKNAGASYQIFIPDSWELEAFDAKVQDGELSGSGIRSISTEIRTERGLVRLSQQSVSMLELEAESQGAISWTALDADGPDRVDAECRNGAITMEFPNFSGLEYAGYEIECKNGTVTFPGVSLEGTWEKKSAGEPGFPYFELEAENGTITVTEQEE